MAGEKEEKTPVELEREKIEMVVHKKDDDGEPIVEEKKEVEVKDPEPEKKEEIEAKQDEIKDEQKDLEKEKENATTEKEKKNIQKRIDRLTAKNKDLETKLAEANAKLAADPEKSKLLTEEDVKKEADKLADQKIMQRDFVNACNKLAEEASKIDKKFDDKVKVMNDEIGAIPGVMIGILEDLDNGAAVLNHLTDNIEDAEDIFKMPPAKMAVELTKISTKLAAAPKKPIKEISQVDDPIKPLGGSPPRAATIPDPKKEPEKWIEWRNKDIAEKRAQGRTQLR